MTTSPDKAVGLIERIGLTEKATQPDGMDSQFYRLSDGTVARYPGGRTRREWEEQVGSPSYEHADKNGYAEG